MGKRPNPLRRVTGSPKDIRAHLLARTELLELVARDPAVNAVLEAYVPLIQLAVKLGALGEDLARRAGLPDRAALFASGMPVPPAYQALNATYADEVRARLPMLGTDLKILVFDTWRLDWPWLVYELREQFVRLLNSLITGEGWAGAFSVTPPPRAADEVPEAYFARLRRLYDVPPGREGVRLNADRIRRDVEIFYRLHLKQPPDSIRTVAKTAGMSSPSNTKRAAARARAALAHVPRGASRG